MWIQLFEQKSGSRWHMCSHSNMKCISTSSEAPYSKALIIWLSWEIVFLLIHKHSRRCLEVHSRSFRMAIPQCRQPHQLLSCSEKMTEPALHLHARLVFQRSPDLQAQINAPNPSWHFISCMQIWKTFKFWSGSAFKCSGCMWEVVPGYRTI